MKHHDDRQLRLFQPEPPYQAHSATSMAAAREVALSSANMRMRVYDAIASAGAGLTDEEGQRALGMDGSTYRPRRVELERAGAIKDSGTTRKTSSGRSATVWVRA